MIEMRALSELEDKFDAVFYISAYIPRKGEAVDMQRLFAVNVSLPEQLCERFSRAKIVYASSVSIYGSKSGVITEESASQEPESYGLSKLWGEAIVRAHARYAVVRISSMYGAGMHSSTFLPLVIENALNQNQITLLGSGTRQQNYIHVADVAQVFVKAAESSVNGVFLAADYRSYSNQEVAEQVTHCLPEIIVYHVGIDNSPSFNYDSSHTYTTLELSHPRALSVGINELIAWKKKQY